MSSRTAAWERDPVDTYVAALSRALRGPRRLRADLVREARDHLTDAAEALQESGLAVAEARRRAVADFGAVEEVAPAYQAVLSSGHSRRVALALFAVTAAQPVAWDLAVGSDEPAGRLGALLGVGVQVVGIACLVAAPLIVLMGGIGVRRLGIGISWVRFGMLAVLVLSGLIAVQAVVMVSVSSTPLPVGLAIAGGIALVPYGAVAGGSIRCLRTLGRTQDLGPPRLRA